MTGDGVPEAGAREVEAARTRQRRIAEIFGDVLPATTADERDQDTLSRAGIDRWYDDNRPPHYDRD